MARNKTEIDLSGSSYDALETHLTQEMGLKVFLVRGWSGAGEFENANAKLQLARTQEAWATARTDYFAAKDAMLGSLRSNISSRDTAIGDALTEDDLMSLKQRGHVTLRKSNTAQPEAVLIFDPVSLPKKITTSLGFSDGKGGETTTINLTTGGSAEEPAPPPREAALKWALNTYFTNLWREDDDDRSQRYLPVENLVENFDIDMDDVRRYETLMKLRYALRNQNEATNLMGRDAPAFLQFAGLLQTGRVDIGSPHHERSFRDVYNDVATIEDRFDAINNYGFKDEAFFDKIKLAGAVMNLVNSHLAPNNTLARFDSAQSLDHKQVNEAGEYLRRQIKGKIDEKLPSAYRFSAQEDWRILFPIFREVYEADKSDGVKREYFDTIMQGLQKFFPTITNSPVPTDVTGDEPPRTLPKSGRAPQAPEAPKPAGA